MIVNSLRIFNKWQFLSYYWVQQVLQNTMHVTTAGVIGTWWFVPAEASSFWSPALSDSVCRATTYSFGSICFGSLLVAIVQALRALEHYSRDNDDFQFLSCIIQCLLGCIEGILESINRWAYGTYGESHHFCSIVVPYLDSSMYFFSLFSLQFMSVCMDLTIWMLVETLYSYLKTKDGQQSLVTILPRMCYL